MATSGSIFDVQRFSIHDGPGIRTTVFFKGCNLRCRWCHNPESQVSAPQLLFYAHKCVGCGACLAVCQKTHTPACTACGRCAEICRHGAREISGYTATAEEIAALALRDRAYYETSGGGVTLSGGEPLLQPDFAFALLRLCKEAGVHTAVETAANVPWPVFDRLLPFIDLVLCDVKGADPALHQKNTGVNNRLILENVEKLKQSGKTIRFRMPYVPGYNDAELPAVRALTEGFPLELMAYHAIGASKYAALGWDYPCADVAPPEKATMAALAARHGAIFDPAF